MQSVQNKLFILFVVSIALALIYLLRPVLTPFAAAALLAYLSNPLVEKMVQWRLPRLVSVIIVFLSMFLVFFLFLLLFIPIIQDQVTIFINALPKTVEWVRTTLVPWLTSNEKVQKALNLDALKATLASKASGAAGIVLQAMLRSGVELATWITNLVLIPVITFYLLRDWDKIIINIRELIPRRAEPVIVELLQECDITLSAFFRGQLLVMLSLGAIYSAGLMLMGLELGLMIGMISGLLSIVPYLGFITGIVSASIAAYIQFGTLESIVVMFVVYAIGQIAESVVLTPKLVGKRIGLHPVAVIFAVLAGGMLYGFFGVLLALPVAAVIMVLLRYLNQRYRASQLYQ